MKITKAALRRLPGRFVRAIFETRWSLWDMIMLGAWADRLLAGEWGPAALIFAVWLGVLAWKDKPWRSAKPEPEPELPPGESIQLLGGPADGRFIKGWRGGDEHVAETPPRYPGAVAMRHLYRRIRPGSLIFEYQP